MTTNKKLNIYLLDHNLSFEDYLNIEDNSYSITKHFIDKTKMGRQVNSGLIYLLSKTNPKPPWTDYIEEIAKGKKISISKNIEQKAIVFLKVRSNLLGRHFTFALTFGGSQHQLNSSLIVKDFAIKVSKSLLTPEKISSIDSIAIDRKIYNIRKQSISHILPDKIISSGEYSIIKKINGRGKLNKLLATANINLNIQVGGEAGLNLSGKFKLSNDLVNMLEKLIEIYINDTPDDQLFQVPETIKKIQDVGMKNQLNKSLGTKFKSILDSTGIDKRNLKGITIQPQKIFDLQFFNGFFITGIGYKENQPTGDFEINEVNYFERLQKVYRDKGSSLDEEQIISKLQSDEIKIKFTTGKPSEKLCSLYQALSLDLTFKKEKYLLVDGQWYKIDRDFYTLLKQEIDTLPTEPNKKINYIPFNVTNHTDPSGIKREGLYNEECAKKNHTLMLDRTKYSPGTAILKKLQFKTASNIELSDIFTYDNKDIHFVHVKRHSGGAAGTSHLLAQAIVSARIYNEDNKSVDTFIQKEINKHNSKPGQTYSLLPFNNTKQNKQITLAIIDKNAFTNSKAPKKNSAVFSLLEMISVRENLTTLKNLGYKCYLKFIDSNEP